MVCVYVYKRECFVYIMVFCVYIDMRQMGQEKIIRELQSRINVNELQRPFNRHGQSRTYKHKYPLIHSYNTDGWFYVQHGVSKKMASGVLH